MERTPVRGSRAGRPSISQKSGRSTPLAVACDDPRAIADLRTALTSGNYTVLGIRSALSTGEEFSSRPADIPVHLRRLPPDRPLSSLIKLFLLGFSVAADESRRALAPASLDRLERLGLIETSAATVRALVRLLPHDKLVVACDRRPEPEAGELPADWVTGIDPPAVLLANLTVRRPARTALDVGTGCGIQALLAAQHSEQVMAVDINPRALSFVEFNRRLNGINNIECRQGNLFEPVQGLSFDLIVCNPPYVISPEHDYVYRDSGLPGDRLCRRIIRDAPGFLNEDGFSHVLVSWVTRPTEDWSAPLRDWTTRSGCDTWLLHSSTEDPLTHAAKWNRPSVPAEFAAYSQTLDRWLDYYRHSGIEAIAFGAIIQRRHSGTANWTRADELPAGSIRNAGDHVQRVFASQDYLSGLSTEQALLDGVLKVADGIRLEQAFTCRNRNWDLQQMTLKLEAGLQFVGGADALTARLLSIFDGRRPLRQVLQETAADEEVTDSEQQAFTTAALPIVHRLIGLGFLVPISHIARARAAQDQPASSRRLP